MKKLIQNSKPANSTFAFFSKAQISKVQQQKLKGGSDDDDGIIVEDLVEG